MDLKNQILDILKERARWRSNYQKGLLQKVAANKTKFAQSQAGSAQKMSNLRQAKKINPAKTADLLNKVKAKFQAKAGARARMGMQKAAGVR